jgi:hypothetical protein
VITIGGLNAAVTAENNDVVGNWKYEVPSAPAGYEKGTLTFTEKEGKLTGEVKFADGYKIALKEASYKDGLLKCGLYINYELITVEAKIEATRMSGKVISSEGEMKLTAEKIK